MVQDLIIVGAGGTGRDLVWVVNAINEREEQWRLRGFLDDDASLTGRTISGLRVLGSPSEAGSYRESRFVLSVASYRNRSARRDIVERMRVPDDRFATIVHPSAHVSPEASLAVGTVVLHGALIQHEAQVGCHAIVSALTFVGHDAILEEYVTLAPGAFVCGSVRLGTGVYVGAKAVVRDGIHVGAHALVGVGAVVTRAIDPSTTVLGNPAAPLSRDRG